MAFLKGLIILLVIATTTYAGVIAPVAYTAPIAAEFDPNPQYSYAYDVQDSITGDSKNHHETRNGNIVHGSYSLAESDGTRRIVDYSADPVNGFNAIVRKEPLVHAAPVVAKLSAPLVAKAAPVAYTSPVAYTHPVPVSKAVIEQPVAYASYPYVAKYAATPLAYTAPLAYSAPVVAKLSAPLVTKIAHL